MHSVYDAFVAPTAGFGKWLRNQETWVPRGLTSLQPCGQANLGNDMKKYSLHLIFTFYPDRDTPVLELFRHI